MMAMNRRSGTRRALGAHLLTLAALLLACGATPARQGAAPAVRCVRAGAQGDGSGADWDNALPQLPRALERGATYLVAAGRYPGHRFADPEAGESLITIRKATAADHGPAAGWRGDYATAPAVWGPLGFASSYYLFDGATGQGRQGRGFEVFSSAGGLSLVGFENAARRVTIAHAELHFASRELPYSDALYGNTPCTSITVTHCAIHDIPGCPLLMRDWTGLTFEHNWVARNRSTARDHAEGVSTHGGGDFIFRDNVWEDIEGTAIIVNLDKPTRNWKIYGNLFVQTAPSATHGLGHGVVSDNFGASAIDGLVFYHNTIAGLRGGAAGLQFWAEGSKGIVARNNLWFDCENVAFNQLSFDSNTLTSCTYPYAFQAAPGPHDVLDAGDPFVDAPGLDFHLKKAGAPGAALPREYGPDPEGSPRGAGGQWGRGALEFKNDKLRMAEK